MQYEIIYLLILKVFRNTIKQEIQIDLMSEIQRRFLNRTNSLIKDDDANEEEEFWGNDDYAPGKSRNKAQTKAPHQNVTKSSFENQNCVEILLLKNEKYNCQEVTLDVVVAPILKS